VRRGLTRLIRSGSVVSLLALVPLLVLDLVDAAEGVVGDIASWIFFFATVAVLAASVVALAPRSTRTAVCAVFAPWPSRSGSGCL